MKSSAIVNAADPRPTVSVLFLPAGSCTARLRDECGVHIVLRLCECASASGQSIYYLYVLRQGLLEGAADEFCTASTLKIAWLL